jgi:hypothetical protein
VVKAGQVTNVTEGRGLFQGMMQVGVGGWVGGGCFQTVQVGHTSDLTQRAP